MDATGIVVLVVILAVVVLIIMSASSARSRNRGSGTASRTEARTVVTPLITSSPGIVVKARRPGISSTSHITTIPIDMTDPIHIPPEVRIFHNQRTCRVCQQSILWSSRNAGWMRCMATNKLVHKDCHDYASQDHSAVRNWCTICNRSCTSGQAMRIEGRG